MAQMQMNPHVLIFSDNHNTQSLMIIDVFTNYEEAEWFASKFRKLNIMRVYLVVPFFNQEKLIAKFREKEILWLNEYVKGKAIILTDLGPAVVKGGGELVNN